MGLGRYVLEPVGAEGVVSGPSGEPWPTDAEPALNPERPGGTNADSVRPHPGKRGTPAYFVSGHEVRAVPEPSMFPCR